MNDDAAVRRTDGVVVFAPIAVVAASLLDLELRERRRGWTSHTRK